MAIVFISFVICVGAASWATSGGMQAVFSVFKTPALLALIPAMALNLSDVEVPIFLSRLSGLLGQAMIPVMLVTLGVQMSEIVKISINFNVIAASTVRLIGAQYWHYFWRHILISKELSVVLESCKLRCLVLYLLQLLLSSTSWFQSS